jgi:hypothetical protein
LQRYDSDKLYFSTYVSPSDGDPSWRAPHMYDSSDTGPKQIVARLVDSDNKVVGVSNSIRIDVQNPKSHIDPLSFVLAAIAITGVAGLAKLIKHKLSKGKRHPDDQKLHVIRLSVECGIEEEKDEDEVQKEFQNMYSSNANRYYGSKQIVDEFSRALDTIHNVKDRLRKVQRVKEFSACYKEAKEDPNQILSNLADQTIEKMLACAKIRECLQCKHWQKFRDTCVIN